VVKIAAFHLRLTALIVCILGANYSIWCQVPSRADSLYYEIKKFDASKALSGKTGPTMIDTVKVALLSDIVLSYYKSAPEKALREAKRQYGISKAIDYKWGMANALEMQGNIFEYKRDYDKALKLYLRALSIYNYSGNTIGATDVTNSIGVIYAKKGIYTEANRYLLSALSIARKGKDVQGYIGAYNNIGLIYRDQNKLDQALKYYFKCLDLQLKNHGKYAISYTYMNIAEIYRVKKQDNNALKYFTLGLEAARKENDRASIANNYSNIGNLYIDRGQYDKAQNAHKIALAIREDMKDSFGLFTSYIAYSNIYSKTGNNGQALAYAHKALQLVKTSGELSMLAEAYKRLADVYADEGNYQAAYKNLGVFKTYSDSIFNSENERKLTEQKMNFEFKEVQEKSNLLAKQALEKQKSIKNYTVGGLSAAGLFIIVFMVRRHKRSSREKQIEYRQGINVLQDEINVIEIEAQSLKIENENIQLKNDLIAVEREYEKNEKEKLQEKLDFNRRELASTTLYLFQKNQMLSELKTEIDALKEGSVTSGNLDKIKSTIQQNLYLDADWDKFKLHFEQVHPDFFKELHERHPGLTAYEVRLYAYLHMKLSTKEIAGLLNITAASVIKAKVRLNKKLNANGNLSQEDSSDGI
jgi:tetratricopeptide (TPR) repeat protein